MLEENALRTVPPPGLNGSLPRVPEIVTLQPSYAYSQPEPEEPVVPLSHYLWILRRHKWRIMAFVAGLRSFHRGRILTADADL